MLQQTFLHLPGIGETRERRFWREGIRDWTAFLDAHGCGRLCGNRYDRVAPTVEESIRRYAAGDWKHFEHCLPSAHKWRALGDLAGQALYVDIETNGYVGPDAITVIGVYDGREARAFVAERDLDKAVEVIEAHPLVVTFNGAAFDMPLIRQRFRHNLFNHIHLDLRFPLKKIGFSGGLKKIEQAFGIERSERTRGLDGWDAVRLWNEYLEGYSPSLDVLVEYNLEDVKNLEPLARYVFEQMKERIRI
ncbi:MAG TPA: ribonuclease H-like domain-containing protein [Kiritimatiellia bacterium]|nr:ribonuclease H-like domain-containing protein [Kiritimatiellia bacterium]HRZ12941.1 ribonuclease H-like domain-containing protein [Kiritimatiellia bacterium]HSA18449.1 ribonuclease H-like domain-containing protein [Kiritimatiellia bacterium]